MFVTRGYMQCLEMILFIYDMQVFVLSFYMDMCKESFYWKNIYKHCFSFHVVNSFLIIEHQEENAPGRLCDQLRGKYTRSPMNSQTLTEQK